MPKKYCQLLSNKELVSTLKQKKFCKQTKKLHLIIKQTMSCQNWNKDVTTLLQQAVLKPKRNQTTCFSGCCHISQSKLEIISFHSNNNSLLISWDHHKLNVTYPFNKLFLLLFYFYIKHHYFKYMSHDATCSW